MSASQQQRNKLLARENERLKADLEASFQLIGQVWTWHRDSEYPDSYNECEKVPCHWCECAEKIFGKRLTGE